LKTAQQWGKSAVNCTIFGQ